MPLVMVMRVRELERRVGEAEGLIRRNDFSDGVDRPKGPAEQRVARGTEVRGFFFCRIRRNVLHRAAVV